MSLDARPLVTWLPAVLLGVGVAATHNVRSDAGQPLRAPLVAALPESVDALAGRDLELGDGEREAARVSAYALRVFEVDSSATTAGDPAHASVYIGYYDRQTGRKTIHSPKNCLPGGGWEPLESSLRAIAVAGTYVQVNNYVLQRGSDRALVLYWYQGRGRIQANEYRVKIDLLRDAVLHRRTEEALVRVVVPLSDDTATQATALAERLASFVAQRLDAALPAWP
jgi:EpsI family protein